MASGYFYFFNIAVLHILKGGNTYRKISAQKQVSSFENNIETSDVWYSFVHVVRSRD